MEGNPTIGARRAVEALRSGVPNRDVVRELGVFQGDVTQKFADLREDMRQSCERDEECPRSTVVSGGFGCGKSHLLEYLRHEALEHDCVCSHVVISKETPLFDPLKLLRAAAEMAAVPRKVGRAVPEILFTEKFNSPEFVRLFQWAHQQDAFGDRIAPLVKILDERPAGAEEVLDKIAREWSGYPMKVSEIRSCLRDIGQHKAYRVKTLTQKELGSQLWRFLPRLFHAAGYKGWVVLFDEVELMLRYSKLQRAKSYANVARLAGGTKDFGICGLLPVFAVTDEFWADADGEKKRDYEIPEWLRCRGKPGDEQLAKDAEAGMKLLKRAMPLRSARAEELAELKDKVRRLHSQAFGWEAPPPGAREALASSSVREHVKSWITQWDMMLLYPGYRPDIVAEHVVHDYAEDAELSREDQEADSAPG